MEASIQSKVIQLICSNKTILLVILLTIVAALPRLYQLGELGFYMDEETTALAAYSLAETGEPRMPSGMPYYRSLPYTWLSSVSAKTFGLRNEFSYRLPAALFGILTIPLIFLLARPLTGTPVAFLAALLLAVSEWHIITSRQARMYAPFLFFYIACSFSILRWTQRDTFWLLGISATLFIVAATLHSLGVFLAVIPLIALFIKDYATTPQYKLALFSVISGVMAYLYGKIVAGGPYEEWKSTYGVSENSIETSKPLLDYLPAVNPETMLGVAGLLLGIWLGKKSVFIDGTNGKEFRILARYTLAALVGIFAATGHFHGAFLSLLLLLLLIPESIYNYLQKTWKPVISIVVIAFITAVITITDTGIVPGIKSMLLFPYPNWTTLNTISPGITILLILAMLYLAAINKTTSNTDIRLILIISLFPLILVGIFMKWAAARYFIQAYPFILIICAYALYAAAYALFQKRYENASIPALFFTGLIGLSGILGGHGLAVAYKAGTVDYGGRLNEAALIFPFYPDHKNPGEYVAAHRSADDIVIAEDVLEQRWYAGPVNYWLRKYKENTGGSFSYMGKDRQLHDIYVNSIVATAEILNTMADDKSRKIWLITSGETYSQRALYLTEDQNKWLEHIESNHRPVFTGKDEITRVYCLNCDTSI